MPGENFEEMLRAMARELGRSVERLDIDEIAESLGVDADRARDWMTLAGGWLREQVPRQTTPARASDTPARASDPARHPLERVGPHPLDLPTDEQGLALAALESGRWSVEPGTSALVAHGDGPGPSDALGLVRELRVRDWMSGDGQLTLTGRRALARWLDTV